MTFPHRVLHRRCTIALLAAVMLSVVPPAAAGTAASGPGFDGAAWIWYTGEQLNRMSAGVGYFRAEVSIPENPAVESAEVIATCDNMFVLYINGRPVGESGADNSAWQHPQRWDLTDIITPGRTVFAVEAVNTLPGPAALILKFTATLADGTEIVLKTGPDWKCAYGDVRNWQQPDFDDQKWKPAKVVGRFGGEPWGKVAVTGKAKTAPTPVGNVAKATRRALEQAARRPRSGPLTEKPPGEEFRWPEAVAYIGDDCSLYRRRKNGTAYDSLTVTIFNPRKSRAFPEHDLPAPMKVGHRLYRFEPTAGGAEPRVLVDAGGGAIGSPSVSWDGRTIFVSMAMEDEPFYHLYAIPAEGGTPQRLTEGPFHDIDPAELPDGRLVFTSTRIGRFEEYHSPPSRSLFVMNRDGTGIRPLTYTIIFDNEPAVMADGRILFIRSDNFFDRGKVETRLHAIHTDGTTGYTSFGLDKGPEYGGRLRSYYCGCPAPLPDGRVAYLSGPGITVGRPGYPARMLKHFSITAGDVASLPDGRLLCTKGEKHRTTITRKGKKQAVNEIEYRKVCVLDPDAAPPSLTIIHELKAGALHSPVYVGSREKPPLVPHTVNRARVVETAPTGVLYCQNARFTRQTTAGWKHVRAIRVIAAEGLTVRSSHSYIVHAGNETIELGTVPLAPDGSFAVEVPANTPVALQAVGAEGRSELNEMSWIYLRPGERRGCVGCHHPRQSAPLTTGRKIQAMNAPPLKLLGRGDPHRFRGNNAAVTGLMELQFDRYRETAALNRYGITNDPAATAGDDAGVLVERLSAEDPHERISAAQRLAVFRYRPATLALTGCLKDTVRAVRVAAAMSLAACGDRTAVPPLIEALDDSDPVTVQAAAIALENLTGRAPDVNPYTGQRGAAKWREWFTATSWDEIEQKLIGRLNTGDRDEARRAAEALGHIGGPATLPPLRAYVAEKRAHNPYPQWKKKHRGDGTRFNAISAVNPRSLQAAARALGYRGDTEAVPLLAETLRRHADPKTGNLFLAEAAAEALGDIGTREAADALIDVFPGLRNYWEFTYWYGDHTALMSCHGSPVHFFIIEALDAMGSTAAGEILPRIIRSAPIDPDRALFHCSDDYETLVGRVVRRHGAGAAVVETCLSLLGDEKATSDEEFAKAVTETRRCWAGHPTPAIRAAQVLSMVCRDRRFAPRVTAALRRFAAKPNTIPRVFGTGIPVVKTLPEKNWVCFYLARTLGYLSSPASVDPLIAILKDAPPEAAGGYPDPLGPGVLFLHNGLTPCWRSAVAWAMGHIGDRRAAPVLLDIVGNLKNATDTRHAAAVALGRIADDETRKKMLQLATGYPEVSTRRALVAACR